MSLGTYETLGCNTSWTWSFGPDMVNNLAQGPKSGYIAVPGF